MSGDTYNSSLWMDAAGVGDLRICSFVYYGLEAFGEDEVEV